MSPTLCRFCEQPNPPDSRFCNACGGQLNLAPCPHCGAVNDVTATNCHQCSARSEQAGWTPPTSPCRQPAPYGPSACAKRLRPACNWPRIPGRGAPSRHERRRSFQVPGAPSVTGYRRHLHRGGGRRRGLFRLSYTLDRRACESGSRDENGKSRSSHRSASDDRTRAPG